MVERLKHDLCIVGAGSGGLALAVAVAATGLPVVLVEKNKIGGDLWTGSIPSKAFLAAAGHADAIRRGPAFGVDTESAEIDFKKVRQHVASVVTSLTPNYTPERLAALGVRLVMAEGRFVDGRTLVAGDIEIRARRFVIATGASPFVPQAPGLDDVEFFTPDNILEHPRKPGHLIVIGGGASGLELAQAHRRLGSEVTVIEAYSALAKEDPEMAAVIIKALRDEGIVVLENAKIQGVEKRSRGGVRFHLAAGAGQRTVDGSHILVAAGRRPNVEGLGLDKAKVAFDRKGIKVTAGLRTTNRRIYAIGDVTGARHHGHLASHHAALLLKPLLFRLPAREDRSKVPYVIFTDPELAHVGLSEDEAEVRHGRVNVYRWPYAENERAHAERATEGHIKVMTARDGTVVGATIAGASASEMISLWALAVGKEMKLADVSAFMPGYPTYSEIGKRAIQARTANLSRRPDVRALAGVLRWFG